MMKKTMLIANVLMFFLPFILQSQSFRPPSVPLVAHDPYFSIWSPADRLYDRETVHWTGHAQPMHSMLRVDGKCYRVMGSEPSFLEPLKQISVSVHATRTVYVFQNREVKLELTFTNPNLVSDLDILSRPVTYIEWNVQPVDSKVHDVQVYFDCGADVAVNTADQEVQWSAPSIQGLSTLEVGTTSQPVLKKKGDNLRIDWGYAYLAVPEIQNPKAIVARREQLMKRFIAGGTLPSSSDLSQPRKVSDGQVTLGSAWNLGKVAVSGSRSLALLAYDDLYSIKYFDDNLRAWWRRNGMTMEQLLPLALKDYAGLSKTCAAFDQELYTDLNTMGGARYAAMCELVYPQCLAAHKLVADVNGKPLMFPKENFSNGCIATVDVIYPASPFFFLFSPELTKATLEPNLAYAGSSRWKFPFAPHDLGTYPQATGQVYGGGEETEENQMPVEETGNMIIMTAALAKMEGNAQFAEANWPVLEKWSNYLLSKGFDPENQLCTDDFAGHLAHNINLSAKAIVALGSYAMLCDMTGRKEKAAEIRKKAESMAKEWVKEASDGDHTKLAFDRPGTWSQKYNLVWDKILGLNLFPEEVIQKELAFYHTKMVEFGLPLDSRERYTKNDWITWTATLASDKKGFQAIFDPVFGFANQTPQRVPVSDWYITDNAYMVGFQARSVVGGFFIRMLADKAMWNKWESRGTNVQGPWAPLKIVELGKAILPPSTEKGYEWKYTLDKPAGEWYAADFSDQTWRTGQAGFGSPDIFNTRTPWNTSDIWIRRTFQPDDLSEHNLAVSICHDEDAEVYINGVPVATVDGYTSSYEKVLTGKKVKEILHPGINTLAVHCHQTTGGQFIDVGLYAY